MLCFGMGVEVFHWIVEVVVVFDRVQYIVVSDREWNSCFWVVEAVVDSFELLGYYLSYSYFLEVAVYYEGIDSLQY